ncbi:unnamed protein product [Clavelina lepadiformis]|uniref:UDP-D-xylose:beta-D-glucoside alpha-1,3-D-xylosyltransferase n=1 Tax=Clavelina lepadiformis TaxID=159417 RepID=A0ABP0GFB0_CLALP
MFSLLKQQLSFNKYDDTESNLFSQHQNWPFNEKTISWVMDFYLTLQRKVASHFSTIDLAVVACGADDRVQETLVNLKSVVLFSKRFVNFHVFTEENLKMKFRNSLDLWPYSAKSKFHYTLYSIKYPDDGHAKEWKKLFKLCASQRLFLPQLLKDINSIVYVDTDVLFLSPIDDLWKFFKDFNSTHLAAMAPESEATNVAWYSRFARHPYYGQTGLNSGIMLMDMKRVREAKFKNDLVGESLTWAEMLLPLYKKYRQNITWGDQDLLNIVFHHNPELLLTFPCKWNYRPDHCIYMQMCKTAEKGVKLLHGCRRAFHKDKWPVFKAVYTAVKDFRFDSDISTLIRDVKKELDKVNETNCKKSSYVMVDGLQKTISLKDEL